jgi:hypothetical protein
MVAMACGCSNSGCYSNEKPSCPIHGTKEILKEKPLLISRMARCHQCGEKEPSSWLLAFFRYKPEHGNDEFYCGCYGWD